MDPVCKDLIDKLLQIKPEDRLGAPNTDHDMSALMKHPFFDGIDFDSDLTQLNIENLLNEEIKEELPEFIEEEKAIDAQNN